MRRFHPVACAFVLLAQTGCTGFSHHSFNVRTFGAAGDGTTKDTAAFQQAINACADAGGGVVSVPAGDYLIGSIELRSYTTLRLEKGAHLIGSPDLADYPVVPVRWEGCWVDGHRALIDAREASGLAVIGPGTISGSPALGGREMPRRPVLIETITCFNIRLEGFATEQTAMGSIHPTYCSQFLARNLTVRSTGHNGDGIDVDSCMHARIENCHFDTGDDCIALKSGRGMEGYRLARATEDVLISGCWLGDSNFAGIGIGSETSGGIRNVRIEHCTFTHAKTSAVYIKSNSGRGGFIADVSARDLDVATAPGDFLRINLISSGSPGADPVTGDDGIPSARNFSFENIKADCGTLVDAGRISPVKPLEGFSLVNVSGTCTQGMTLANMTNVVLRHIRAAGYTGPLLTRTNVQGAGLETLK